MGTMVQVYSSGFGKIKGSIIEVSDTFYTLEVAVKKNNLYVLFDKKVLNETIKRL